MHELFLDRIEAGKRLAKRLGHYHASDAAVLAIPCGGVPVAASVAHRLGLPWNVIVVRKLAIPWNPEAGFGAVAADGSVVINSAMVGALGMSRGDIDKVVTATREEIDRRNQAFGSLAPRIDVSGKCAIVIDDGLASGYTMLAAIKSMRAGSASKVVAAAPVASRSAAALVGEAVDECVFEIVSPTVPFAVADYYVEWHDLSDDDVMQLLQAAKDGAPAGS